MNCHATRLLPCLLFVPLLVLLPNPGWSDGKSVRMVAPPMKTHDGSLVLRCPLCQKPCKSQKELVEHVRFGHPVLKCEDCNIRCATPEALREHRRRYHRKGIHPCPDCGAIFADLYRLRAHRESSHGSHPQQGWPCRICGRSFDAPSTLDRHRAHAHPRAARKEKPKLPEVQKCAFCEMRLPLGPLMDQHLRLKHPKHDPHRVRCPICRRFFPNGKAMELHIRLSHTELPGIHRKRCPLCKAFLLPEEWAEHQRKEHPSSKHDPSRKPSSSRQ